MGTTAFWLIFFTIILLLLYFLCMIVPWVRLKKLYNNNKITVKKIKIKKLN